MGTIVGTIDIWSGLNLALKSRTLQCVTCKFWMSWFNDEMCYHVTFLKFDLWPWKVGQIKKTGIYLKNPTLLDVTMIKSFRSIAPADKTCPAHRPR
jgi:hypothetical protein